MDGNCWHVDRQRNGGDANLEEPTMQGAQAGDDARRNVLAGHLGAGATQPRDPATTTEEPADGGGGAPVILQPSKTTLMQQFRWQCALDECGAFLWGEQLAGEVVDPGCGINRAQDDHLLSVRSRKRQ